MTTSPRRRRLWLLPPLAAGIALVAFQVGQREAPTEVANAEPVRAVRVVEALRGAVVPVAEGFGPVQPARVWTAVAQVAGRVVSMAPDLGNGRVVTAGTELLRIDPVDYELALARIDAERAELDITERNTRASLAIEQRGAALARREFERIATLVARGTSAQSAADAAERELLNADKQVQALSNTLALLPARRAVLDARRRQAERDIARTRIDAPFDMKVADLAVETGQFVGVGQSLLKGDAIDQVEVVAQVSIAALRNLVLDREAVHLSPQRLAGSLAELAGFRPRVELDLGTDTASWPARFERISDAVDAATRTVGLVVTVDDVLGATVPGRRPPLTKGMFVRVVIRGRPLADRVVVPRHAVRDGAVWLADGDDRLARQPVTVAFEQAGASVIAEGLVGGERVVLTDVVPPVAGMSLAVHADADAAAALRRATDPEADDDTDGGE